MHHLRLWGPMLLLPRAACGDQAQGALCHLPQSHVLRLGSRGPMPPLPGAACGDKALGPYAQATGTPAQSCRPHLGYRTPCCFPWVPHARIGLWGSHTPFTGSHTLGSSSRGSVLPVPCPIAEIRLPGPATLLSARIRPHAAMCT